MLVSTGSLRRKRDELAVESQWMDVVCVRETWFHSGLKDEDITMEGFHLPLKCDREDSYGGVAVYVRSSIACKGRLDLKCDDL